MCNKMVMAPFPIFREVPMRWDYEKHCVRHMHQIDSAAPFKDVRIPCGERDGYGRVAQCEDCYYKAEEQYAVHAEKQWINHNGID